MRAELTTEKVMEKGRCWRRPYLLSLTEKEVLSLVSRQKLLDELDEKEWLAGLNAQKRLTGLFVEEIEAYLQQIRK